MKKRTMEDFIDKTGNTFARFDEPKADRSIWIQWEGGNRGPCERVVVGHAYKLRSGSTRYRSTGPFSDMDKAEKAFLRLVAKYEVKQ